MNTLSKIILKSTIAISLVITCWSIVFYVAVMHEIDDETEDSLELLAFQIVQKSNEGTLDTMSYKGTNNSFTITPITKQEAEQMANMSFKDTNIFIADKNETEPCKQLTFAYYDTQENYYKLQIYTPTIEKKELKERVLVLDIIILIILIISVTLIYIGVIKRNFKPIYILMKYQKNYHLGKQNEEFPVCESKIEEYQELFKNTKESYTKAEETYQQQKLFIGHASHEIQTPLAVSITQLETLLEDDSLTEQQMNKIFTTLTTLRKMTKMNKSLLLLSKIENNQFNNIENININTIIKEKIELFKETFSHKEIQVQIIENSDFIIEIDNILCEMLINNLLKNAFVHNNKQGEIKIEINKDSVIFSNTGKATSLNSEMIFNYFYKESNEQNSSGLGLVLTKTICKHSNLEVNYQFFDKKHTFFIKKV